MHKSVIFFTKNMKKSRKSMYSDVHIILQTIYDFANFTQLTTLSSSLLGFGKTKRKRVLVTLADSRWRSAKEQPNWSMPNSRKIMRILRRTNDPKLQYCSSSKLLSFFLLPPSQSLCLTDCQNLSWSDLRVCEVGQ